jgi:hypothetical protein
MPILYNLKSADGEWRITKFDDDLEMESSYIVSTDQCECPQWTSRERECRHMKMLPMMLERADSPWFFCYEDAQWYDPTGQAKDNQEVATDESGLEAEQIEGLDEEGHEGFTEADLGRSVVASVAEPVVAHRALRFDPSPTLPQSIKRRI